MENTYFAYYQSQKEYQIIFSKYSPSLIVFGNDTGHPERAALSVAYTKNIPTLLVQDGFLYDAFSKESFGRFKLYIIRIWVKLSKNRLGLMPYGMGGSTYIAAYGKRWANIFNLRKTQNTQQVFIVGHPRLTIKKMYAKNIKNRDVLFLCTNFLTAYKDKTAHKNQIREIINLYNVLFQRYGSDSILRVRIHPADKKAFYSDLEDIDGIVLTEPEEKLETIIYTSWLCITNISAASIDCLYCGRVCLMSGVNMYNSKYKKLFSSLPGEKFLTWEELTLFLKKIEDEEYYNLLLKKNLIENHFNVNNIYPGSLQLANIISVISVNRKLIS